jgi:hypothetical protein
MDWADILKKFEAKYRCKILEPVNAKCLDAAQHQLGPLPQDLLNLYVHCNGLRREWLNIFPIEDRCRIKITWDSLQRNNDINKTVYLGRDKELLSRFLVFATIGGGECAVIDRTDGSIWYEEAGNICRTELSLADFIDISLQEVTEF